MSGARGGRGFVLLEVLLALTILGFSMAALMRSFTQSLAATKTMEVKTQAIFFAQQLLHEFELFPPDEGKSEGGFGDDYKYYSFRATVRYAEPDYKHMRGVQNIEKFFDTREVTIEIVYDDGDGKPFVPIRIDSALTGFEKFSAESKRSYMNF